MIHYFYKDQSEERFLNIKLEAWKEDKDVLYTDTNEKASSFTRVEEINYFASLLDNFESITLRVDLGKNSCRGHRARSFQELKEDLTSEDNITAYKHTNKKCYKNVRKRVFEHYKKQMFLNLEQFENKK